MEEAISELRKVFKKLIDKFIEFIKSLFKKISEINKNELIDKLIKYRKYQKRVQNRNKLYNKRKAKYGKN